MKPIYHTKVQIGDNVSLDPVSEIFAPLRGSDKTILSWKDSASGIAQMNVTNLLGIPAGQNDRT
jgi:hypothetical protein